MVLFYVMSVGNDTFLFFPTGNAASTSSCCILVSRVRGGSKERRGSRMTSLTLLISNFTEESNIRSMFDSSVKFEMVMPSR